VANPYGSSVGCLDHTIAYDDAHVEHQVSPNGGEDEDHGDDPHDIPQPESEDIAQSEAPALPVLKENEV
jgi:hypothetical protein